MTAPVRRSTLAAAMGWRFWVVDMPAKAFDVWQVVYWSLVAVGSAFCLLGVLAMLTLWFGFGIRWGW